MSCNDFVYSPRGRQGIGVIQPQSGLDYPFVSPSADVRFLFADFFLSYDDPADYGLSAEHYALPLRLSWISGIGCDTTSAESSEESLPTAHAADLIVVDANGQVVIDTREAQEFTERAWGADYTIYAWEARETPNTPIGAVCRAVIYKTWPESFEISPQNYPKYFTPNAAVLDARATYRLPKRVLSLRVRAGNEILGNFSERNSVALLEGYNMQIIAGDMTAQNQTRGAEINFAAIPGAGAGQYSDCNDTPSPPILSLAGATPNKYGDLLMAASDCGYVRLPTEVVDGGIYPRQINDSPTLTIGDDCPPCCDCPDYVNLALYMNRLHARYKLIGDRAKETKLLYDANLQRWKEQYNCRTSKPLSVLLVPQYCSIMDVVAMFCNHCDDCVTNVQLHVAFSTDREPVSAAIVCGYTEINAPGIRLGSAVTLVGEYPDIYADLPPIGKGESGYVKFRLRFSPRLPIAITATVTGTSGRDDKPIVAGCDDGAPAASATTTETLNCDSFGNNSQPC